MIKRILASTALLALFANASLAFDTGSHSDLTRTVLAENGFKETPIKIAQVENWLTDYYSSAPTIPKSRRQELEKLHFDNLYNTEQVRNYWGILRDNVESAGREAARNNDPQAMLTVLAIGLHAVQDFYTHSNWAETHPRIGAEYRTEVIENGVGPTEKLFTGKYPADRTLGPSGEPVPARAEIHGDYTKGMNHDSQVRPKWDEAYVFAYVASDNLVQALKWVSEDTRPGFWKRVQEFAVSTSDEKKLDYDIRAARNMSMWITLEGSDGHWKGDKSGYAKFFSAFSGKWVASDTSVFARQIREGSMVEKLTANLYKKDQKPAQPGLGILRRYNKHRRAVIVRVTNIKETNDVGLLEPKIDPNGSADFYTEVTIGGQVYRERVMQNMKEANNPWWVIHFVDGSAANVPIKISVFDEDDTDAEGNIKDDVVDINPAKGKADLQMLFGSSDGRLSGDVNGQFGTEQSVFISSGAKPDKNRAVISAYITQVPLEFGLDNH